MVSRFANAHCAAGPGDLARLSVPAHWSLDGRICRAEALMRHNLHRKVTLHELAVATALSVSRFSHLFKSASGVTPVRFMKHLRLQVAKELLENSLLSVKEIAAQVGLDASRLAKEFRQTFGLTPLQYRRLRWTARREFTWRQRESVSFNHQSQIDND